MMSDVFPMTTWYSTLGIGDGHDFATRGYLKALMSVGYSGLRLPPSVSTSLLRFDKTNQELSDFAELSKPPKEVRMKPLKLIEAGDPRIGTTYKVESYGMSGERVMDKEGNPAFMEVPYTEGAVDPDVEQERFSKNRTETRCVVIHHDPASICRHYTNMTKQGRAPGVAYVGITVWETSEIPEAVAMIMSELDMIIVPSQHAKKALNQSGVSTKIIVIPHAFDEERWPYPKELELGLEEYREKRDRFVFYTIATPIERKNLIGLMRAYFKAFEGRKDVVLRIKSSATKGQLKEMAVSALEQADVCKDDRPPLQFFTGKWPIEKIREFHLDGDCYVSATRSEGFGLCLRPGTLVTTKNGVKPVEYVSTMDEVISHDGDWHHVLKTGKRNIEEEIVRIEAMGLPDTYLTKEHPVLIARRGSKERKYEFESSIDKLQWVESEDVRPNDYLVLGSPVCCEEKNSFKNRAALLQSLIRSDGSNKGDYIRFTSTSPVLAFQTRDLWLSVGIPAGIKSYIREGSDSLVWEVGVYGKYMQKARSIIGIEDLPRKTKTDRTGTHFVNYNGKWLVRVTNVKQEKYKGSVYNLQVADTETFVANGFLVHNCELEAKLCGNRVITTNWGAAPEILDEKTDSLVDYKLVPVFNMQGVGCYEPEQKWAEPCDDSLAEAFLRARREKSFCKTPDVWLSMQARYGRETVGQKLAWALDEAKRIAQERDDEY